MGVCVRCSGDLEAGHRFCPFCGLQVSAASPAYESRRLVTVVFADVLGSTELGERLDPEEFRALLLRYHAVVADVLRLHGGTVEKFIGDAVVAAFGVPQLRDDDALRAVTAAAAIVPALARLNEELRAGGHHELRVRIGVNTGEVLASADDLNDTLVLGDVMNTGSRLGAVAGPDEVVMSATTHRLVRDRVDVESLGDLQLRGRSIPVGGVRLRSLVAFAAAQSETVGRDAELALLRSVLDEVTGGGTARAVHISGPPGIGKSHLLGAFEQVTGVRVVTAGCRAFGQPSPLTPLLDVVRAIGGDWPALTGGDAEIDAPTLLGLATVAIGRLAAAAPACVVVEDVHWAQPTLLRLLVDLRDLLGDSAVLWVSTARPEELDATVWPPPATVDLALGRLDEVGTANLLLALAPTLAADEAWRSQLIAGAAGNPLYLTQLVGLIEDLERESGGSARPDSGATLVPPTLALTIAARLDRLSRAERTVVECASVLGDVFPLAPLPTLLAACGVEADLPAALTMVRLAQIFAPEGTDGVTRFEHALIRTVTYDALSRERRAVLHAAYADWLEAAPVPGAEEPLAHHLEQAFRLGSGLLSADLDLASIARRAAWHLLAAARQALERHDGVGAQSLAQRALDLPHGDADLERQALLVVGEAVVDQGRVAEGREMLERTVAMSAETGDARLGSQALIALGFTNTFDSSADGSDDAMRTAEEAIALARRSGDAFVLAKALGLLAHVHNCLGRQDERTAVADEEVQVAAAAGDLLHEGWGRLTRLRGRRMGSTPLPEVDACAREDIAWGTEHGNTRLIGVATAIRAEAMALMGGRDEALALLADAATTLERVDAGRAPGSAVDLAEAEIALGLLRSAAKRLRTAVRRTDPAGNRGTLSTIYAILGGVSAQLGELDEAAPAISRAREWANPRDYDAQVRWRRAAAMVAQARGDLETAVALLREAVDLLEGRSMEYLRADTHDQLAGVLRASGDAEAARRHDETAAARRSAKGVRTPARAVAAGG